MTSIFTSTATLTCKLLVLSFGGDPRQGKSMVKRKSGSPKASPGLYHVHSISPTVSLSVSATTVSAKSVDRAFRLNQPLLHMLPYLDSVS